MGYCTVYSNEKTCHTKFETKRIKFRGGQVTSNLQYLYFSILGPSLSIWSWSAIVHTEIVNTYVLNTIEFYGFPQRLQESSPHASCQWPHGWHSCSHWCCSDLSGPANEWPAFWTGSEAMPSGHVNGPIERWIRPVFLQPWVLDGIMLTQRLSKDWKVTAVFWTGVGQWKGYWRSASIHR